ncbi:MAG: alpha-amylase family protein [Prevotella sp.]|nr:alpha-amylase family protein [Prevotella sp.]
MKEKLLIYQVFTRLYGNRNTTRTENGTLAENGCGKMNDFSPKALKQIAELGMTHIWYTGIIRHATQTDYTRYGIPANHPAVVKGKAGSPYAITDYYDVDPDLAVDVDKRMQEFEQLVERTHKAGLKVIIDFVPNHVARQYHSVCKPEDVEDLGADDDPEQGFDPQNNFYYCPGQRFDPYFDLYHGQQEPYIEEPAKATGNDHFDNAPSKTDWYETVKLNYGVDYYAGRIGYFSPIPSTWLKMTEILLFWASKGVDGFRCDMAEMVPADFWRYATGIVKQEYDNLIFIGEVYNPYEYRRYLASGFDYLYDKVGMYDTMRSVICHNAPTSAITGAWQQTDDIRDQMLYFLENHDEQRIASDFFAGSAQKGMPALIASVLMQQNPFMLYAGEEYGERGMDREGFSGNDGRTTIFDYWSVDTLCRAAWKTLKADERRLYELHQKVFAIARKEKAVANGSFFDLMYVNGHLDRQYVFLRKAGSDLLLIAVNFDDRPVSIGVNLPAHAFDFLSIPEKKAIATDLLSGEKQSLELVKDGCVALKLESRGGSVWKINASKRK